jgi:hypothetical protein
VALDTRDYTGSSEDSSGYSAVTESSGLWERLKWPGKFVLAFVLPLLLIAGLQWYVIENVLLSHQQQIKKESVEFNIKGIPLKFERALQK